MVTMAVERTVRLVFSEASRQAQTHTNLSAVRLDAGGTVIWIAGDETATVERLVAVDPPAVLDAPAALDPQVAMEYGHEFGFRLADLIDLPGRDPDEEADVEGIACDNGYLWVVGSHSLRRKRIREQHVGARALRRLARVGGQANRQLLARIPIEYATVDGLPQLRASCERDGRRERAAVLPDAVNLRRLLAADDHLAPFLQIPGKDNGLDIEGIAVAGERVYLGLRGPVLRGWAIVLELTPYVDPAEPTRLRLRPFADGAPYRKHLLDLDGLGVRDLCPHGEDLLVLAGPTMDLDGPVRVYRWRGAYRVEEPLVVRGADLTRVLDLPYGDGDDHAEGIGLVGSPDRPGLLVVYDSPAKDRLTGDGAVLADVVQLPD